MTPTWTLQRTWPTGPGKPTAPLSASDAAAVLIIAMFGSDEPVTVTSTPTEGTTS